MHKLSWTFAFHFKIFNLNPTFQLLSVRKMLNMPASLKFLLHVPECLHSSFLSMLYLSVLNLSFHQCQLQMQLSLWQNLTLLIIMSGHLPCQLGIWYLPIVVHKQSACLIETDYLFNNWLTHCKIASDRYLPIKLQLVWWESEPNCFCNSHCSSTMFYNR